MGKHSFIRYSTCVIENVNALEVIEMGDLNEYSYNFYYASLELKSILIHSKWWLDMPSLKSLIFGRYAFRECSRVVFESDWLWCEWLTRLAWIDFHSIGWRCILQNTFLGVEEWSHSQRVMTRHAFSQITRLWWGCIPWLYSCRVWEWVIVMWVTE